MNRILLLLHVLVLSLTASVDAGEAGSRRPRLVLLLSVDQMRGDYLTRFEKFFAPPVTETNGSKVYGGFAYLRERGAWFVDAKHTHFPLFTGPGHAVQLTGAHPYKTGIVGNYWYDAHEKIGRRYCVEDLTPNGEILGRERKVTNETGISPVAMQVTTVGDELRIATANLAKVWGLALKDRAAVLMAGHLANGAVWFDEESGNWVSSRYYCTNGELPGWVTAINKNPTEDGKRLVDTYANLIWSSSLAGVLVWTGESQFAHSQTNKGYKDFTATPWANDFVFRTAQRLIENEGLGTDEAPDILSLNFSSNDYVGHKYGADSAEVVEITVQTDRQLGRFFTWLDARLGLTNIVIVLTSDHGVSPYPKQLHAEAHFDADIGDDRATESELNDVLKNWFGLRVGKTNAATLSEYNLYIHKQNLRTDKPALEIHEQVADYLVRNKKFGYYAAYTREQILTGRLPRTDIAERVMKGFSPENSGDIVIIPRPFWVHPDPKSKYKTSHGSPYVYDTAVPLLIAGAGVKNARCLEPVSTLDIAPTLAYLLGILQPSGCEGRILGSALADR